jgi:hypothetical protein
MPNTMTLISTNTLSSSASSVTFSSIPTTFTDLKLTVSARSATAGALFGYSQLKFNGSSTSDYSGRNIYGISSTIGTSGYSAATNTDINGGHAGSSAGNLANSFTNTEAYIPNYNSSTTYKSYHAASVTPDNTTVNYFIAVLGLLRSNNAAITSLTITDTGNFVTGSTFSLYGISNS